MKYEEAIKDVGGCGPYQIFMLNLLYIGAMLDGLHIGGIVFSVLEIKHRCAIPDLTNDTYEVQGESHAKLIKEYIPEEIVDGEPVYSKCHLYQNKTLLGNQTLNNCTSWVYDKSIFQTSITSDFNLVCGNEWLTQQIYVAHFAGHLVGSFVCGWLSDRVGRKTVIIIALMLQGVAGILFSISMNINVILILRSLISFGGGSYIPSIVLGAELSSMKDRTKASTAIHFYFTAGLCIITLMVYFIRNWTLTIIMISIPSIPLALFYIWLLPESPRWLLTVKREKEARVILDRMASVNKRHVNFTSEDIEISVVKDRTVRLWKIFTIPQLLKRTLIMMFNWFALAFVYYLLMVNSEHMSGNIFLNFFFAAFVEVPGYLASIFLVNRVGRKKLYMAFLGTAGICAVMTIFPFIFASDDLKWTTTVLSILCKLFISGNYGIIYLHTCELYPTCVRSGVFGFLGILSKVGGSTAPLIMKMRSLAPERLGESLPLLTMGFVCILASVSYFFLPETSNRPMKDTFDDLSKNKIVDTISGKDELEAMATEETST